MKNEETQGAAGATTVSPPYVTPYDASKKRRLVKNKLMGISIADYFKMNTGEQIRDQDYEEEDWLGSSGDKDFFEQTSDQIMANWEQYSGTRLTSSGALLVNKETTEEPECEEDPSETGLGAKREQVCETVATGEQIL